MRCSQYWNDVVVAGLLLVAAAPLRAQTGDLPPAGYGTLRQDQIGVRLQTPAVTVRVIPLDERVIRLLAVDAYQSLHELTASRAADIRAAARAAGKDSVTLFIVTFYGLQPQAQFSPDQVYITSQAREFRPVGWVALTSGFAESRIDQRQQAMAIYLFEPGIEILRPFTVSYTTESSDTWTQSLNLLDAERSRARSRAQGADIPH